MFVLKIYLMGDWLIFISRRINRYLGNGVIDVCNVCIENRFNGPWLIFINSELMSIYEAG